MIFRVTTVPFCCIFTQLQIIFIYSSLTCNQLFRLFFFLVSAKTNFTFALCPSHISKSFRMSNASVLHCNSHAVQNRFTICHLTESQLYTRVSVHNSFIYLSIYRSRLLHVRTVINILWSIRLSRQSPGQFAHQLNIIYTFDQIADVSDWWKVWQWYVKWWKQNLFGLLPKAHSLAHT